MMIKGILVLIGLSGMAHARIPVWTFTPIGSPVVSVSNTGTATVSYTVTNNSVKPHQLVLSSNTPSGITHSGGACVLAGRSPSNPTPTCTLALNINGSQLPSDNVSGGPILCQTNANGTPNPNQCNQPSPGNTLVITRTTAPGVTTLIVSASSLALSVTGLTEYGISPTTSGIARRITITNTGSNSATNVGYSLSPSLPSGSSISPANCGTITAGNTCTLTITPGATPSAAASNQSPTPIVLSIAGSNTNTVTTNVNILTYGSYYQGGYVYAFNDTTAPNTSVGGKVVTATDQAAAYPNGIIWSSNGAGGASANVSYDIIYGISETSTASSANPNSNQQSGQTACLGKSNGACNTNNIYVYYQNFATNHPINLTYYAAGLCKATISGYSDWYLPAICEMGYDTNSSGSGCGSQSSPTLQNIQKSLREVAGLSTPDGFYWSSTEYSVNPQTSSWTEYFASSGSYQDAYIKGTQLGARCSRAFTP